MEPPFTEDGFYMLSVVRHLSLGNGITIDGEQWTNGFQPLFAFLLVPVYWLFEGDRFTSLRGVLAMHWLAHLFTAYLLAAIVRDGLRHRGESQAARAFWVTAFLWLVSRHVVVTQYNGLETGFLFFMYVAVWRLYQLGWNRGWKALAFGIVLGLLVLTRIDAAVFVAVLVAFELLRDGTFRERGARFLAMGLVPLFVSAPWWLYNRIGFGSIMPISGTAQSNRFSTERIGPMVEALLQVGAPYVNVRWLQGWPHWVLQGLALGITLWMWKRVSSPLRQGTDSALPAHSAMRLAKPLGVSTALLTLYYLFNSGAEHFYGRYTSPFMLISIPLAALALSHLLSRRPAATSAAIVLLSLYFIASVWMWRVEGLSRNTPHGDQLRLVERHVPAHHKVSAGQTGTLGYFRDHVVNLDGKVNPEALPHLAHMTPYLEAQGIVWYCDVEAGYLGVKPELNGWMEQARLGSFILYHRPSADTL